MRQTGCNKSLLGVNPATKEAVGLVLAVLLVRWSRKGLFFVLYFCIDIFISGVSIVSFGRVSFQPPFFGASEPVSSEVGSHQ